MAYDGSGTHMAIGTTAKMTRRTGVTPCHTADESPTRAMRMGDRDGDGMSMAEDNARAFGAVLDNCHLHYAEEDDRGRPTVRLCYDLGWESAVALRFWFDGDGKSVQ